MDDNEDDYELENNNSDYLSDDFGEEEEQRDADAVSLDSWESFHERVEALVANEHCEKPVRKLDTRRRWVMERMRMKHHKAPKSIRDRALAKKSQVEQQLETSDERLGELVNFGNELVTNIRVANERRELDRRTNEANVRTKMNQNLKRETQETTAKFEAIKARWEMLEEINEPMSLWEQMEEQKKRIADIMSSKDDMIEAAQTEIRRMNAKYEYDRERQAADLCCLVERIDHQVETLKEAYKQHLQMLRHTIDDERQLFSLTAAEKWRSFFDSLNASFDKKTVTLQSREDFYSHQTMLINEEQEELTKETRVRLDKECDRLELELRRTRDNVLMNSEKLDYNYQVLQKRNEENVLINNQQKRRVARLHEVVSKTRRELRALRQAGKKTIKRLSAEIYKLHSNISDMEVKAHLNRVGNKEKFDRVWEMHYDEMMYLVNRIYTIDRTLHEQQMMVEWPIPTLNTDSINDKPKRKDNLMARFDLRSGKIGQTKRKVRVMEPDIKVLDVNSIRLMHNIMRKISDRGGFLLEERLLKILEPFQEKDQCLVRIDNIFAALRIRQLRDIQTLTRIFEPFTYCPICHPHGLSPQKCAEVFMHDQNHKRYLRMGEVEHVERRKANVPSKYATPERKVKCEHTCRVMEPALVLHALNIYTSYVQKHMYQCHTRRSMNAVNYISVSDDAMRTFWRNFVHCFPEDKSKLWTTLEHGLNHYSDVLKLRKQYDAEVVGLRRQNIELRHLLKRFKN